MPPPSAVGKPAASTGGDARVPQSVGTPNYIDLNNPDVILVRMCPVPLANQRMRCARMPHAPPLAASDAIFRAPVVQPHDDDRSTSDFAEDVKNAFVDAERLSVFRFQPDNVRNQTEHVLLLLANIAGRNHLSWADESDLIVSELFEKVFEVYNHWCENMQVAKTERFYIPDEADGPPVDRDPGAARRSETKSQLANLALFWCVWGEGSNCRHIAELMCYFFFHVVHRAALQARGLDEEAPAATISTRSRSVSAPATPTPTGRHSLGAARFSQEKYIDACVSPVYNFLKEQKGKKADHAGKINFSDMNEFFWTAECRRRVQEQLDDPAKMMAELGSETGGLGSRGSKTIGDVVVGWMRDRGKTYSEHRGLRQIAKTHNRTLTFYTVMLYLLIILGLDQPFQQDTIPSDVWGKGNASRHKYLEAHPAMFTCGLPHWDERAANIGLNGSVVCCRISVFTANWTRRGVPQMQPWVTQWDNMTEGAHGKWELEGNCAWLLDGAEMTQDLKDNLAMTAPVISGLLWLRALLIFFTDFGVTGRRCFLFTSVAIRTVFTVVLVAASWHWYSENKLVQWLANDAGLPPSWQFMDRFQWYFEHNMHFYVGMSYTALYFLEEIIPPIHEIGVKFFSLHTGSPWLTYAKGVVSTGICDFSLMQAVGGWLTWVAFLVVKMVFSYQFEIREQIKHSASFWMASHCYEDLLAKTTNDPFSNGHHYVCPSYDADDFNLTDMGVSNIEMGWFGKVAETPNEIVSIICDFQCEYIINTVPFKFVLMGVLWVPTVLVYFLDTQVIFAFFQTFVGCAAGAHRRVASLNSFEMFRKKFQRLHLSDLFEEKISTYRGNFGEADVQVDNEDWGDCYYVDADGVKRRSFFSCPRMTTFRLCWDRYMEAMRSEDLLSDKEVYLFRHPSKVPNPTYAQLEGLANQRVECFGQFPLFLLAGGMEECLAIFDRARQQMGSNTNNKVGLMEKCVEAATHHATAVPAAVTAWKNGVRLVEAALEIFAEDQELGFSRTVDAIDSEIDSALGSSGGGAAGPVSAADRVQTPNLTHSDVDGPTPVGTWVLAMMAAVWGENQNSGETPEALAEHARVTAEFALNGKVRNLVRHSCDLVDSLLDGRLMEHEDQDVRDGVKKMRRNAGTSMKTNSEKGIHPLLCAARALQKAMKDIRNLADSVLAKCGAAEVTEEGDKTSWAQVKVAMDRFCSNSEEVEKRVMRVCEHLLTDEKGAHSLIVTLFHLLKTTATDTEPKSEEVIRRMLYWGGTLHMKMPKPPRVDNMLDYTTLVPFYNEEVIIAKPELMKREANGMSIGYYLRQIHEDDWKNFEERMDLQADWARDKELALEFRLWASNRSQTLARCIRGMMTGEQALQALAEAEGYSPERARQLARQKNCVVVSCQIYGDYKKAVKQAQDDETRHGHMGKVDLESNAKIAKFLAINEMLERFPHLRVAYIDNSPPQASVLIKWDDRHKEVVEVYRIQLPGPPIIGEGKPENQNHAMIFTRGRFLQTVDMNQDGYFEEALKMRNLLEEFQPPSRCGKRKPVTMVGFGEHQFSAAFNAAAEFSALSEFTFTTLVQRTKEVWGDVRMHYGHPDLHDRLWLTTRGGVSKAISVLCINEDIFGAYETMLRGGRVVYREYTQAGKGKDMGFSTVGVFEAKIACGNAEQALSRDMYRINESMGLFRLLAYFHTSNGFFLNNICVVWATLWFILSQLFLTLFVPETQDWAMVVLEKDIIFLIQLGMIQTIPLIAEVLLEKGLFGGVKMAARLVLLGGPIFYLFHVCTRWYYYLLTIDVGGAKYRASGRGFIIEHVSFLSTFQQFGRSHFVLGLDMSIALIILGILDRTGVYFDVSWPAWLFACTCMWAPFLYNFEAVEYQAVRNDFREWWKWMMEGQQVMAGWDAWNSSQLSLYKGVQPMLIFRGLTHLFIPLATAFK